LAPTTRLPEAFHHVGYLAKGRQQLITLGPQLLIVLIDARNDRLELIQTPEFGAKSRIILRQVVDLLVQQGKKLTALIEPARDILSLRVHAVVQAAFPSTGANVTGPSGSSSGIAPAFAGCCASAASGAGGSRIRLVGRPPAQPARSPRLNAVTMAVRVRRFTCTHPRKTLATRVAGGGGGVA
jgi:hypothetical protein